MRGIFRLVHHHSEIPVHAENSDAENVLGLADRDVGLPQDFRGIFDALLPRNELRWLPILLSFSFHTHFPRLNETLRGESAFPMIDDLGVVHVGGDLAFQGGNHGLRPPEETCFKAAAVIG